MKLAPHFHPAASNIPYSCQNVNDDDVAAVIAVLRSEFLTQGPVVASFERKVAIIGARRVAEN